MRKLFFALFRVLTLNYYFQKKQKNVLLILMFHQVNDSFSAFYPAMPPDAFKKLISFVKSNYKVIHVSEINGHFSKTCKPAAVISFDDAHYDILAHVFPILSELEVPFNVNVDTEVLETGKPQDYVRVYDVLNHTTIESYYNPEFMQKPIVINRNNPISTENEFTALLSGLSAEEKRKLTEDLALKAGMKNNDYSRMLSAEEVAFLSKHNVELGSHSHTHAILPTLPAEKMQYELTHSKEILEELSGRKVEILAYPNGVYDALTEELALKAGYKFLLQTDDRINLMRPELGPQYSFKRMNQYHKTLNEALAHTYGIISKVKRLLK